MNRRTARFGSLEQIWAGKCDRRGARRVFFAVCVDTAPNPHCVGGAGSSADEIMAAPTQRERAETDLASGGANSGGAGAR